MADRGIGSACFSVAAESVKNDHASKATAKIMAIISDIIISFSEKESIIENISFRNQPAYKIPIFG